MTSTPSAFGAAAAATPYSLSASASSSAGRQREEVQQQEDDDDDDDLFAFLSSDGGRGCSSSGAIDNGNNKSSGRTQEHKGRNHSLDDGDDDNVFDYDIISDIINGAIHIGTIDQVVDGGDMVSRTAVSAFRAEDGRETTSLSSSSSSSSSPSEVLNEEELLTEPIMLDGEGMFDEDDIFNGEPSNSYNSNVPAIGMRMQQQQHLRPLGRPMPLPSFASTISPMLHVQPSSILVDCPPSVPTVVPVMTMEELFRKVQQDKQEIIRTQLMIQQQQHLTVNTGVNPSSVSMPMLSSSSSVSSPPVTPRTASLSSTMWTSTSSSPPSPTVSTTVSVSDSSASTATTARTFNNGITSSSQPKAPRRRSSSSGSSTSTSSTTSMLSAASTAVGATTITAAATTTTHNPRFRDYQTDQWTERYEALVRFYEKHGHSSVPHNNKADTTGQDDDTRCLARWVKRQRYQWKLRTEGKPSAMTDERIQLLNDLGFVWDSHSSAWEDRLRELEHFKSIHKHCNVPSNYRRNTSLASWVKCQRRQYRLYKDGKKSNMTPQRIKLLDRLGFKLNMT